MKKYILAIVLAFLTFCVLVGIYSEKKSLPDTSAGWLLSENRTPPSQFPIIGIWIDSGQPISLEVIEIGGTYYEYDALHPEGPVTPLRSYPPVWWISLPGGAK